MLCILRCLSRGWRFQTVWERKRVERQSSLRFAGFSLKIPSVHLTSLARRPGPNLRTLLGSSTDCWTAKSNVRTRFGRNVLKYFNIHRRKPNEFVCRYLSNKPLRRSTWNASVDPNFSIFNCTFSICCRFTCVNQCFPPWGTLLGGAWTHWWGGASGHRKVKFVFINVFLFYDVGKKWKINNFRLSGMDKHL